MEETLSYPRFISFHRNQINPEPHPVSTLTFAYGDQKYGKFPSPSTRLLFICRENVSRDGRE